ncbi:hypothetical protein ES705_33243 [subsurface metagenome]
MRTDRGPGVNGQGAGYYRIKIALGEPVFDLGGACKRGCQGEKARIGICRKKFWTGQKTVLNIAAPRRFPRPLTKDFGSQTF